MAHHEAGHTPEYIKGKECEKMMPTSVDLYVFRHAKSDRKETTERRRTGKWHQAMHDITDEGAEELREHAHRAVMELDAAKQVAIFLSSPRARAMESARIVEEEFRNAGFDTYAFHGDTPMVQMLRSGGDASHRWGTDDTVIVDPKNDGRNTGKRFRDFLSYFASINQDRFLQMSQEKFHGKVPVFISVTHGEVVHGERNSAPSFQDSFFGKMFPEKDFLAKGTRLHSGRYVKLSFDLQRPGDVTLQQKTEEGEIKKHFQYNQQTGEIHPLDSK